MDSFKTSKGKFIEPLTLENYFADLKLIEEICITGLGPPRLISPAQLSEIGKLLPKDEIKFFLEEKLAAINANLENYKKISNLFLEKE